MADHEFPAIHDTGEKLRKAWRLKERRAQRRRRLLTSSVLIALAAVPVAIGGRSIFRSDPHDTEHRPQHRPTTAVAHGDSPSGPYELLVYTKGSNTCLAIALASERSDRQGGRCRSPRSSISVDGFSTDDAFYVFGLVAPRITKVRVQVRGGLPATVPVRSPDSQAVDSGRVSGDLRFFLAMLPAWAARVSIPIVIGYDSRGHVVVRHE